jgi:hypothetical protein
LVVPFLTDRGIFKSLRLVERLVGIVERLEVVSSDWGFVHELGSRNLADPVLGRLLTAQHTDPRMGRLVGTNVGVAERRAIHMDGTLCDVQRRAPSAALVEHFRCCWIDRPEVVALLQDWGIYRCELSNTLQGIHLQAIPDWSYSLHMPEVLVAVTRPRPQPRDGVVPPAHSPVGETTEWTCGGVSVPFFQRDNALYYRWNHEPTNLADLPINRIVRRE